MYGNPRQYCLNVLLPEAVLQILLWRSAERQSLELLDPDEESRLHEIGAHKAQATDWVRDVMRLRESQLRMRKKRSLAASAIFGGTKSRPKRNAVV